ncbi:Trihydroxynaphthalene reductase [Venturia inaequalis]|nr:Trihydroxynaphthalene reductase [Venturia inaequalis]
MLSNQIVVVWAVREIGVRVNVRIQYQAPPLLKADNSSSKQQSPRDPHHHLPPPTFTTFL